MKSSRERNASIVKKTVKRLELDGYEIKVLSTVEIR
jgi:hypothetical protein